MNIGIKEVRMRMLSWKHLWTHITQGSCVVYTSYPVHKYPSCLLVTILLGEVEVCSYVISEYKWAPSTIKYPSVVSLYRNAVYAPPPCNVATISIATIAEWWSGSWTWLQSKAHANIVLHVGSIITVADVSCKKHKKNC